MTFLYSWLQYRFTLSTYSIWIQIHLSEKNSIILEQIFAVLTDKSPEFHIKYDTDTKIFRHGIWVIIYSFFFE